jgi:hypothetical protein
MEERERKKQKPTSRMRMRMKKRTTAMTLYQINMDVKFSAYTDKQSHEGKKEKKCGRKRSLTKEKYSSMLVGAWLLPISI